MKFVIAVVILLIAACRTETPVTETATSETTATSPAVATATTSTETAISTTSLTAAPAPTGIEPVAGPKLTPVDQASADPELVLYRSKLLEASKNRDAKAFVALLDPKIRTSFGGDGGHAAFEKLLATPGMWKTVDDVLSRGGAFVGDPASRSFWAPYVYSNWPDRQDAFSHVVVIAEEVPLRKTPDASSEVVALLSHDIVERPSVPVPNAEWVQVKTADGRSGFVDAKAVMSPVGYRAGFAKQNGKWVMNAFVAGD
jgi:hypothetical protein